MLIVTGTKRSGTSMWMQILVGAGFPAFGEPFPGKWGDTIRDANPAGFYESVLRRGIYYRTNPHPVTGDYFFPEQVEGHICKVFIPGLVRSDRAFITRVVATMRPWREYEASLARLFAMEDEQRGDKPAPPRLPAHIEWWAENFALIRDIATRRYPVNVQSYDSLLADPERVIRETLKWIGKGDADAAIAAVNPEHRTQRDVQSESFDEDTAALCDELYALVDERRPLTPSFIAKLNQKDVELSPLIREAQQQLLRARKAMGRAAEPGEPAPEQAGNELADKASDH